MKVSICLCTYNGEKYLKEQLQSIVNQTMLPDEIVVCDDCSTDKTVDILNDFAKSNLSIVWRIYVNEHNVGWRINFRNCIERAEGDYIFLSDQDDLWNSDKIKVMTDAMQRNDKIELLISKYSTIYEENAKDKNQDCKYKNSGRVSVYNKVNKLSMCLYPGCVFLFKKSLKEIFFQAWDAKFAHDQLLTCVALLRKSAYMIDYASIGFRRHDSNASSNYPIKRISRESRVFVYNGLFNELLLCENLKKVFANDIKPLNKQIKWLKYRIGYYEKPKIYKFIKLFFYKKYYRNFKNYLKDINALLYK